MLKVIFIHLVLYMFFLNGPEETPDHMLLESKMTSLLMSWSLTLALSTADLASIFFFDGVF